MSANSKALSLPDVTTPGTRPPLVSVPSKHSLRLKRRPVPPLLALVPADLSPYMQCRSLKNSPRSKGLLPSHRKTASGLSLGNSPTTTNRARAATPETGLASPTPYPRRSSLLPQFSFQPFRGKLEHFRQLFDQIIEQNATCAPVLEEIRTGYEEVIRQTGLETLRSAAKPREDYIESRLCENLIEENRQLAKQASSLRKQLHSLRRENTEFRRIPEGNSTESASPIAAFPRLVPLLNLRQVPASGFQDEFMALADAFSQSWRDAIKDGR